MAARDLKPSRRALLGAAVAMPFVGCAGGEAGAPPPRFARSPSPSKLGEEFEWGEALAAFRVAEAALRAFEARTAGAPWEAQEAVEREMDERLDALGPAIRRLMRTPAPDLGALAKKIELMVDHDLGSDTDGAACLAALKRDARRLARG